MRPALLDPVPTLRAAGGGDPVLVLHGGAGPASVSAIVEHLADHHLVLAPTHPGWEGTARPEGLRSVADLAAAYLALLDQRGLRHVTVLGSSFGGWVAAEMALQDDAGRLGALVLVDAIGPPPTSPPAAPPGGRGPSPADLALLQSYTGSAMSDPTLLPRLAGVRVPALVVWGELDPILPSAFGAAYAATFRSGEFAVIPGAGHLPTADAPAETGAVLDAFLSARGTA